MLQQWCMRDMCGGASLPSSFVDLITSSPLPCKLAAAVSHAAPLQTPLLSTPQTKLCQSAPHTPGGSVLSGRPSTHSDRDKLLGCAAPQHGRHPPPSIMRWRCWACARFRKGHVVPGRRHWPTDTLSFALFPGRRGTNQSREQQRRMRKRSDAVEHRNAQQVEALPHDHRCSLAQQQPAVLLLAPNNLQAGGRGVRQ